MQVTMNMIPIKDEEPCSTIEATEDFLRAALEEHADGSLNIARFMLDFALKHRCTEADRPENENNFPRAVVGEPVVWDAEEILRWGDLDLQAERVVDHPVDDFDLGARRAD